MMMRVSVALAALLHLGTALSLMPREINIQVDNAYKIYADGEFIGEGNHWPTTYTHHFSPSTKVISVEGFNAGGPAGMVFTLNNGVVSNKYVKCMGASSEDDIQGRFPNWTSDDFDASAWDQADFIGKYGVSPWRTDKNLKQQVNTDASWIWDQKNSKYALCRIDFADIERMKSMVEMNIQVDNSYQVYADGAFIGDGNHWPTTYTHFFNPRTQVIGLEARNAGGPAGIVFTLNNGIISDKYIKCMGVSDEEHVTARFPNWASAEFDDSTWEYAEVIGEYGMSPWKTDKTLGDDQVNANAYWIWDKDNSKYALCRIVLPQVATEEPLDCPEQRAKFLETGLPVFPTFNKKCKFLPKQCNAEKCWCVNAKTGAVKYGGVEIPIGEDFTCKKKPKKCQKQRFSIQLESDFFFWLPDCTAKGKYAPKQCDEAECWCVNKKGKTVKGTKTPHGQNPLQC